MRKLWHWLVAQIVTSERREASVVYMRFMTTDGAIKSLLYVEVEGGTPADVVDALIEDSRHPCWTPWLVQHISL